jgi:hypothetical protein
VVENPSKINFSRWKCGKWKERGIWAALKSTRKGEGEANNTIKRRREKVMRIKLNKKYEWWSWQISSLMWGWDWSVVINWRLENGDLRENTWKIALLSLGFHLSEHVFTLRRRMFFSDMFSGHVFPEHVFPNHISEFPWEWNGIFNNL